jgi:hypothetical protein
MLSTLIDNMSIVLSFFASCQSWSEFISGGVLMARSIFRFSSPIALVLIVAVIILTMMKLVPARAAGTCNAFASVTQGKYWVNNNLWGQKSGSGWQCIWDTYTSGSTIGWGTSWSWSAEKRASVKSYASTVLGWHWGWKLANTGLPVQLSANRNVNTAWDFNVTERGGTNTMNIAYDLWLHTISNPTWSNNPSDEVMIWLYRSGGAGPLGTYQTTVTIAGTSWDLYQGNIGWNVFSFVRKSNTTSADLNLRDFLNYLVAHKGMSNAKYLTGIQAGAEVFHGAGQLDTRSYYTNIQ